MKQDSLFHWICFTIILVNGASGYGETESNLHRAKNYIRANDLVQAIDALELEIAQNSNNAEAHFILGKCYLKKGNVEKADERFKSALDLEHKYRENIGAAWYRAFLKYKANRDAPKTVSTFNNAVSYKPDLKAKGYPLFLRLANETQGSTRNTYLDQALALAVTQSQRNEVAQAHPPKSQEVENASALDTTDQEFRETIAVVTDTYNEDTDTSNINQELDQKNLQKLDVGQEVIFDRTYRYSDAFDQEYGQISTFHARREGVKFGDTIQVIAKLVSGEPFSGGEIWAYYGGDWVSTKNGMLTTKFIEPLTSSYFTVSLGGRKDVEVTVKVVRTTTATVMIQ